MELEKEGNSLISESVNADEIAAIVAEWTGIPVKKLVETNIIHTTVTAIRMYLDVIYEDNFFLILPVLNHNFYLVEYMQP